MSNWLGFEIVKREILLKMLFKEKCPLFTFRTIKLPSHFDAFIIIFLKKAKCPILAAT